MTPKMDILLAPDVAELKFNAARLRSVAKLVGIGSVVPQDDEMLDSARGSVLGMIAAKLRITAAISPAPSEQDKVDALLWALYHHQGGSSPIGQPIRKLLGIGQYDRLTTGQIEAAKAFAARSS